MAKIKLNLRGNANNIRRKVACGGFNKGYYHSKPVLSSRCGGEWCLKSDEIQECCRVWYISGIGIPPSSSDNLDFRLETEQPTLFIPFDIYYVGFESYLLKSLYLSSFFLWWLV
ncbi:hypothetical protein CSKR_108169 [Clonorchis sinensis]|uniref:Uncharacterized protein n=2 Tax=Clonorchis sinensis TaxID=79923 RepID=A0A8T1M219_CLOSI|nr:hypothetical protein CSKR_108169 [Clonorchis sinensis]GAA48269.1 hypothetical protein CLF_101397 [Clonorchis sinensis]